MLYIPKNVSGRPHQVSYYVKTFDALFVCQCESSSHFFIQSFQRLDAFYKSSFFLIIQHACMFVCRCQWPIAVLVGALSWCLVFYSIAFV